MTDLENRLAAAFAGDAPSQSDAIFRIAVLERYERRQFRARLALVVLLGAAAIILLWMWVPTVATALKAETAPPWFGNVGTVGLLVASVGWGLQRAFRVA